MLRLVIFLAAGLGLLGALAQPSYAAARKCAGAPPDYPHARYPEPRVFVESQAWWTRGRARAESGRAHHVHLGLCFPQGRVARFPNGRIRWDIRVVFHNMRGYRAGQLKGGWFVRRLDGKRCRRLHCEWYFTVFGKTRAENFPTTDGRKELRPKVRIKTPDGFEMFQSAGWQLILTRGRRRENDRPTNVAIGRGWYTDFGYANVGISSYRAPGPRVSGVWRPKVSAKAGDEDDLRVTSHLFTIDPDFHKSPADRGKVIRRGRGSFQGRLRIGTRGLSPGMHKLVMIAHSRHVRGPRPNGTNTGVEVLPFWVVRNAGPRRAFDSLSDTRAAATAYAGEVATARR
jgi:hypothetical protein